MREELALAQGDADAVGAGVEGPDEQNHQQDPAPLGPELGRGRGHGQRRRDLAEANQPPEHAHVHGRERRRHPRREAHLRVLLRECGDAADDQHGRHQQICVRTQLLNRGHVRGHCQPAGDGQGGHGRIACAAHQPDRLPGCDGDEDGDQRSEPWLPEGNHEQQGWNEEGGAERPLTHPIPYRPNRRCRLAYSTSAASKASGPKSGQRIGLK